MKSNKQRRKKINLKRQARAEKLRKELENTIPLHALGEHDIGLGELEICERPGIVAADVKELEHNNTYGLLLN